MGTPRVSELNEAGSVHERSESPNLLAEALVTVAVAAKLPPYSVGGRASSASRVFRHISCGVIVQGSRIRLECVRVGGRVYTSREAVARFVARCSAEPVNGTPSAPTKADSAEHEKAARRLAAAGL